MVANLYLADKHPDLDLKASNTSTLVPEYPQPRFQHKENPLLVNVALNGASIIRRGT